MLTKGQEILFKGQEILSKGKESRSKERFKIFYQRVKRC